VTVMVEGRSRSLPAGLTTEQALRRLGLPAAGDLLAVDHSVLRKGAFPRKVLVNGQPASATRHLHRGDRITVARGRTRIEPVAWVTQLLAASRPGSPMRLLPTGPAEAILDRGKLSGRVVPVAFHPAAGAGGSLPVALTFDDGPWPHSTEHILTIFTQRQAPATFFVVGRQVQRYPELVRRELAAGMALGSHSYSHPQPFDRLPVARIRNEITRGRPVTVSFSSRTRSLGTTRFSTTGSSSRSTTSYSSSEMSGPEVAASKLGSVIGSRSMRAFSRRAGRVYCTCSVVTYLRSRTRPRSRSAVPTRSSSSERVMASSVVGPDTSRPTVPRLVARPPVPTWRSGAS
jgi:peptidoglycan/xylan/chitin deacetylase (PgdA/CDA1 family)